MFPIRSNLRKISAAAATTLLAATGLTGLGVVAATPAHAASARPADAGLYQASCYDAEINGQTDPAYPIACTAPAFPSPWSDTAGKHTQSAVITLRNTSGVTVGLTPHNYSGNVGKPGGIVNDVSVPVRSLPPGASEQVVWTLTLYGPFQVYPTGTDGAPFPSTSQGAGIDISGPWGPNADVGWGADYPVAGAPAPVSYSLTASASTTSLPTGSGSTITVANTGNADEHLTLCSAGRPIAAGIHGPGSSLVHTVVESTAGTRTFTAYAGASFACSGTSKTVSIDWTGNAPTPTPVHTSGLSPVGVAGSIAEPAGFPDPLFVANTEAKGGPAEWLTMCINGRPVASGKRGPGGVVAHAVDAPTVGAKLTVDAFAGSNPAICGGPEQSFTIEGLTERPSIPSTAIHLFSAATSVPAGTTVPTWTADTASGPTWVTLCKAGTPVASAWLHPGQAMPHDVVANGGSTTFFAHQGRASCASGEEASIDITW